MLCGPVRMEWEWRLFITHWGNAGLAALVYTVCEDGGWCCLDGKGDIEEERWHQGALVLHQDFGVVLIFWDWETPLGLGALHSLWQTLQRGSELSIPRVRSHFIPAHLGHGKRCYQLWSQSWLDYSLFFFSHVVQWVLEDTSVPHSWRFLCFDLYFSTPSRMGFIPYC